MTDDTAPVSKKSALDLLLSGWKSDFTVIYGDRTYHLHKPILEANASFFRSLFSVTPEETTVNFTERETGQLTEEPQHHAVSGWVLDRLIQVWYTNDPKLNTVTLVGNDVFNREQKQTEIDLTCAYLSCDPIILECGPILVGDDKLYASRYWGGVHIYNKECNEDHVTWVDVQSSPFEPQPLLDAIQMYLDVITDFECPPVKWDYCHSRSLVRCDDNTKGRKIIDSYDSDEEHRGYNEIPYFCLDKGSGYRADNEDRIYVSYGKEVDLTPYMERILRTQLKIPDW